MARSGKWLSEPRVPGSLLLPKAAKLISLSLHSEFGLKLAKTYYIGAQLQHLVCSFVNYST